MVGDAVHHRVHAVQYMDEVSVHCTAELLVGETVLHRMHTCTAELMIGEAVHHRMHTCTAELIIGEARVVTLLQNLVITRLCNYA